MGNRIRLPIVQRNAWRLEVTKKEGHIDVDRKGKLSLQQHFLSKVWDALFGNEPVDLCLHLCQAFLLGRCSDQKVDFGLMPTLHMLSIKPST